MAKAYKCDVCGKYYEGLPVGVLYDNQENTNGGKGKRTDLCLDCLLAMANRKDESLREY
jgi:hypothetical protein